MNGEHRAKIAAALRGKQKTAQHCQRMAASRRGVHHNPRWKRKISDGLKGKPKSAEHRARIAAALRGKRKSAQHCASLSLAKIGVPHRVDQETISFCKALPVARRMAERQLRENIRRPSVRLDWRLNGDHEIHEILVDQLYCHVPTPLEELIEKEEWEEERKYWVWRRARAA